ncbi:RNA-binding (RRM/RBD/RNP motifs) family protein [Striga hermonthica]|uniref:Small ribosomal subunit protein cS22 n=1 Tax=Striga hermonthica TaxID=68872 RepID=A0A9N7RR13_STRHE|nr:RNA-binding (RRM/RBD/RNP motifs) family protein [Striga hermonthica]
MATFSSPSSFLIHQNFLQKPTKPFKTHLPNLIFQTPKPQSLRLKPTGARLNAVSEAASVATADPSSVAARRLYVGNIPRTVTNEELQRIVDEHGAVEKAEVMYDKYSKRSRRFAFVTMKTVEDASAALEKLNDTEIGGRKIKVNITEKPLAPFDQSVLQTEESQFVDSPYKVYVGNLAKTVTTDALKSFFAEKGKVLGAKISRVPGTSKSSGYGFVSFGSEGDVEAAISSLNNAVLEGQKIRVNKA